MKLKYIILSISIFVALNIIGQKTNLSPYFKGREMTSFHIATNIQEAHEGLDKLSQTLINEKEISIQTAYDFSSQDTLFEIIRVDSCKTCFYYDRYIINISKGLSLDTYRSIIDYARKFSLRKHYIDNLLYNSILYGFQTLTINHLINTPIHKKVRMNSFIEKLIILSIDNGNVDEFNTEYYRENFITDAVCKSVVKQLQDPKFPPYLLQQFMEDNKQRWDPSQIDTTGVPQKYIDNKFLTCMPTDTICKKYNKFKYYDALAKEKGITPEEALYQSVENEFYYKGFKRFTYMIDYAIEKNDTRLLPAIKKFIKNYPEYELTDKQTVYFKSEGVL